MNTRIRIMLIAALLLPCAALSGETVVKIEVVQTSEIRNLTMPETGVWSGGQPSPEQLQRLARAGIKHVINLRPQQEQGLDEGAKVRQSGMTYHSLPIAGAADITLENADKLAQLLARVQGEPVLVHCGSGNRVGALIAVAAGQEQGIAIEAAIERGRQWGLTKLEPVVRERLTAP